MLRISARQPGQAGEIISRTTGDRVNYTLDSTLDSVNVAEQRAEEFAAKLGFDEDSCQRIAMSVREAVVNAVLHGNAYDPEKKVSVAYETNGDALVIRVADQGGGLDPTAVPDPLAPENLLKQSGRGIFLIRSFMDEVRFRDLAPGTEVTLVKNMGDPAGAKEEGK